MRVREKETEKERDGERQRGRDEREKEREPSNGKMVRKLLLQKSVLVSSINIR